MSQEGRTTNPSQEQRRLRALELEVDENLAGNGLSTEESYRLLKAFLLRQGICYSQLVVFTAFSIGGKELNSEYIYTHRGYVSILNWVVASFIDSKINGELAINIMCYMLWYCARNMKSDIRKIIWMQLQCRTLPDRPFHNSIASKSEDRRIPCG